MWFVYILENSTAEHYYTGITQDIGKRVTEHNGGNVFHTAKYKPWSVKTYIAFRDKEQAYDFEKYLKTASGRAFAKKRF
jgi:predicted GIY-YIG superfamily endonuclease